MHEYVSLAHVGLDGKRILGAGCYIWGFKTSKLLFLYAG
jgi:hypothetical protein